MSNNMLNEPTPKTGKIEHEKTTFLQCDFFFSIGLNGHLGHIIASSQTGGDIVNSRVELADFLV